MTSKEPSGIIGLKMTKLALATAIAAEFEESLPTTSLAFQSGVKIGRADANNPGLTEFGFRYVIDDVLDSLVKTGESPIVWPLDMRDQTTSNRILTDQTGRRFDFEMAVGVIMTELLRRVDEGVYSELLSKVLLSKARNTILIKTGCYDRKWSDIFRGDGSVLWLGADAWLWLMNDPKGLELFDPSSSFDAVNRGYRGVCLGTKVYTDAFRDKFGQFMCASGDVSTMIVIENGTDMGRPIAGLGLGRPVITVGEMEVNPGDDHENGSRMVAYINVKFPLIIDGNHVHRIMLDQSRLDTVKIDEEEYRQFLVKVFDAGIPLPGKLMRLMMSDEARSINKTIKNKPIKDARSNRTYHAAIEIGCPSCGHALKFGIQDAADDDHDAAVHDGVY